VFREIQCRMLGMAVTAAADESGREAARGEAGELVCTRPAPCMPVGFWPLPGFDAPEPDVAKARERYQQAYFRGEPGGAWCKRLSLLSLAALQD
jgi:acetoacetyl-CoA synthetase